MERSAAATEQDNQSACSTSMLLAGKWQDGTALWGWTHTQPYAYSCIRGKYICLGCEMYYVDRMTTWKNVPERGGWWDKLTTSRGRKASSCRRTSSPTAPPMDVALSKDTTSSWVRPFRSTPFTWTGDIRISCGVKHWSNSNLINIWKLITTTDIGFIPGNSWCTHTISSSAGDTPGCHHEGIYSPGPFAFHLV